MFSFSGVSVLKKIIFQSKNDEYNSNSHVKKKIKKKIYKKKIYKKKKIIKINIYFPVRQKWDTLPCEAKVGQLI